MNLGNTYKIKEIVSSIFFIRSLLLFVCLFALLLAIFYLQINRWLYLFSFLTCIGYFLFPVWFFQGIEEMKYISIISLITKLIFLPFIFLFIKTKEDYLYFPLFNGLGTVIGGLIAIIILLKKYNIRLVYVKKSRLISFIQEAFHFFVTSIFILLKERLNVLIIGSFIGLTEVAYYDLASKLVDIGKIPFKTINRVLFPNFSKALNKAKVKKALIYSTSFGFFIYLFLCLASYYLILLLGGENLLPAKEVLYILGFNLPLAASSSILGISLAAKGYTKAYMLADIYALFVYLVIVLILILFQSVTIYTLPIAVLIGVLFTIYYKYKFSLRVQLL